MMTSTVTTLESTSFEQNKVKTQAMNQARIADRQVSRAIRQAESAETSARRIEFKIKNETYTYEVKLRLAEENALKAKTETDAWPKFSEAQAKANVKKSSYQIAKDNEEPKKKIVESKQKILAQLREETRAKRIAGDIDTTTRLNNEKSELHYLQLDVNRVKKETHEAKKEWDKAKSEAKKAKKAAEEVAKTKDLSEIYAGEAFEIKNRIKSNEEKAKLKWDEAKARRDEANAKQAEAKAWEANKDTAEEWREIAKEHKQKALAFQKIFKNNRLQEKANKSQIYKNGTQVGIPAFKSAEKEPRFFEKKHLSAPGLFNRVKSVFQKIPDSRRKNSDISLCDCLMSGLAVFSLKYPSLLQFDQDARDGYQEKTDNLLSSNVLQVENPTLEEERIECVQYNLKNLYGIKQAPSDTYMRESLDKIDPSLIGSAYNQVFGQLQRGKELEQFAFLNGHYLLAGDASQYFSSNEVHCENCCTKRHRDGHVSYYHQAMSGAIVHPDHKPVIPFCPEPIINMENATKNDCEQKASERLFRRIRKEHPHLPLIVTYDNLQSNGPFLKLLNELDMRYIIVVSPSGNKSLFEFIEGIEPTSYVHADEKFTYEFRYINNIPLNDTHSDMQVNFFEVWVRDLEGNLKYHNSWVTDIPITNENIFTLYRGGRARWKIENENFNTLKNQGYHFEHNFGHGHKHLTTIFMLLLMLAFLIDQVQQLSCGMFQAALKNMKSKVRLWSKLRSYFFSYKIDSWEQLWRALAFGILPRKLTPKLDSS